MGKALALGAIFYQATLAFGLLIAVARLLPPGEYAAYSIFIAVTQFGAVLFFEWLKFACSRFYPGRNAFSEARQRGTILVEAAISAALCILAGLLAIPLGVPPAIAGIGTFVVIGQGGSDLYFHLLRFGRRLGSFSWAQGLRATLLAIGTLAGTLLGGTIVSAVAGLLGGYFVFWLVIAVVTRRQRLPRGRWSAALAREHLAYGNAANTSSLFGALAPLGLRLIVTGSLGAQAAAGALLALDLLQRPFLLILHAIQAIQYPEVVAAFDSGSQAERSEVLGRYYALMGAMALLTAAGTMAILNPIADFAVAADMEASFLAAAPWVVVLALLRSVTQNLSLVPAHLRKQLGLLVAMSVADCLFINAFALVSGLPGAALGAVIAALVGVRILIALPARFFVTPPVLAALSLAVATACHLAVPRETGLWGDALTVAAPGLLALATFYALFRMLRAK